MLRGVNKQIIEINETGNRYFEKAILFVNAEYPEIDENKLYEYADNYLKSLNMENKIKSADYIKKSRKLKGIILSVLLAVVSVILLVILL